MTIVVIPALFGLFGGNVASAEPLTTFPDGVFEVGTDIAPGVYTATGFADDGVYSIVSRADDGSLFVRQDNPCVASSPDPRITQSIPVTINSNDVRFGSVDCGTWTLQGPSE
ncbi:hypothetical protein BFN03_15000 [Rhodococcus sp. WMMA185]|nr:hypothetical protein BFN03_15000 [Rhodococcus sp. WMMA185]